MMTIEFTFTITVVTLGVTLAYTIIININNLY